jgi:hypothetical protein
LTARRSNREVFAWLSAARWNMQKLMLAQVAVLLLAISAGAAAAQTPAFDPRDWKGSQAGPPTEVLTLGSPHLSGGMKVDGAMMSALLDKLAAYHPDIVTAENVSGEQCDLLRRYGATYPGSYDAWCLAPDVAQKAIGLDGPAAAGEIEKLLAAWPANPTPAARRRLAALFLAAGEKPSARVQWLRLAPAERHAGDGITGETLKLVERVGAKPNETYEIAAALAARLGLERVYLVDDHTSDGAVPDEGQPYADAIGAAWKVAPSMAVAHEQQMEARLQTPEDVLALYRFVNEPRTLNENIKADFGQALRELSPGRYGRQYVADWEVRNLRMVANIVAAFASHPGARVLNVVGSSHKAYYDAYLGMMHDVALVDAEAALK